MNAAGVEQVFQYQLKSGSEEQCDQVSFSVPYKIHFVHKWLNSCMFMFIINKSKGPTG